MAESEAIRVLAVRRDMAAVAAPSEADPRPSARALHNGRLDGELGRATMAFVALLPLLMWVTGLMRWIAPRQRKRSEKANETAGR